MIKRNTIISKYLIQVLEESHRPLSVPQILQAFKKEELSPNKSTIYRLIDKLVANGTIKIIIGKNGTSYYEKSNHNHHHFFCNSCEQIFCLPSSKNIDVDSLIQNKEFKITGHDFNIYGICEPCNNN